MGHFPSFQVLREASMGVAASDTYLNTILFKVYSIKKKHYLNNFMAILLDDGEGLLLKVLNPLDNGVLLVIKVCPGDKSLHHHLGWKDQVHNSRCTDN